MKNITEEQIDNIIDKVWIGQNENVLSDFVNNYEAYKKACDETIKHDVVNVSADCVDKFINDFAKNFACFKMAQDNCIGILKQTLKELLCENEEE